MRKRAVKTQPASSYDAYLDIETTGLSWDYHDITVIGIYRCRGKDTCFTQLYGRNVTRDNLLQALEGVSTIYTYNGRRFDLPFIDASLGINLELYFKHTDLMYNCWERNLKGGFKSVEKQLGIERETEGVNGYYAVLLWNKYIELNDEEALNLLLRYNRDDVVNLKALREKLLYWDCAGGYSPVLP